MSIQDYLSKLAELYLSLMDFLENEEIEENFQYMCQIIEDQKIRNDLPELKIFLRMLVKISNYHRHTSNLFSKIEQILKFLKIDIQKNFTKLEIFQIFKSNKRLLLFLIEEKMISVDKTFLDEIIKLKTKDSNITKYFTPEILSFLSQFNNIDDDENEEIQYYFKMVDLLNKLPEDFNEKRKKGENDDFLCNIIRNDLIDKFIAYVNQKEYPLENKIKPSIYETNKFLNDDIEEQTLIHYATFFGSVQIFKYLFKNGAYLFSSLWIYAAYSGNQEIFSLLEENLFKIDSYYYEVLINESIKCHNNDVTNFIRNNYLLKKSKNIFLTSFHYCNFSNIQEFSKNKTEKIFFLACEYDYLTLVKLILSTKKIDINTTLILIFVIFLMLKHSI